MYGILHAHVQELKLMEEGAVVYKLIGPALVKQVRGQRLTSLSSVLCVTYYQEKTEATENVAKRLEFIGKEV